MTAFFDLRDLWRGDKRRNLRLCLWLIAVVTVTLVLFLLKFLEAESTVCAVCAALSFAMFFAELICVFRASDCRVTPLLVFLTAFYLVRNGQLLLLLFGVPFDIHHLVPLLAHRKDAFVLISVGNIWGGLAGVVAAQPSNLPQQAREVGVPRGARVRELSLFLAIGGLLTWGLSCAEIVMMACGKNLPALLSFIGTLFLPFGFSALALWNGRRACAAVGALASYFCLELCLGDLSAGVVGLIVLAVYGGCLRKGWLTRGKRAAVLVLALIGFAALAIAVGIWRSGGQYAGQSPLAVLSNRLGTLGNGCLSVLAMCAVVPASQSFLLGREYVSAILSGILPTEPRGALSGLTADTQVWAEWCARYLQTDASVLGFSLDAEAYLNFAWFGFLAVFAVCLIAAFLLERYRCFSETSAFPKYAAMLVLWTMLTLPGKNLSHAVRFLFWGIGVMSLAWHFFTRRYHTETERV